MNRYNGWANYATWRVNLEIFDGINASQLTGRRVNSVSELKDAAKEYAESVIFDCTKEGSLMEDYARAFLSEVEWWEIANHLMQDEDDEVRASDQDDEEYPTDESRSYGPHYASR
jgi:hypothetical protein